MLDIREDFGLTDTGDIAVVEGAEQVRSHVAARLRHILGEDYFDQAVGVPWFSGMFSTATSYEQKAAILRSTIAKTPGVLEVVAFEFGVDPVEKLAIVNYSARTIFEDEEIITQEVVI